MHCKCVTVLSTAPDIIEAELHSSEYFTKMKKKHFQLYGIKYLVEVEEMFLEIVSTPGKLLLASRTFLG